MKSKILNLVAFFFIISIWSQKGTAQKDLGIYINGINISTKINFNQQIKQLKKSESTESDETQYNLLNFKSIPSIEEQLKLKIQGVVLLDYIGDKTYFAAVNPSFYNNKSSSNNINTILPVDPKYKLDALILNGIIPEYAVDGNNIKVIVTYFEGVKYKVVSKDLESLFVEKMIISESFHEVYLQTTKRNLEKIAKLNWVQNIELIPSSPEINNLPGVTSSKSNILGSTIPGLGYGLTGKGVKVGIWDTNIEQHKDHTGRLTTMEYELNSNHGSHVSGILGGAGLLDPRARGIAPEVQIYGWNFWYKDGLLDYMERERSIIENDIDLTSNSYSTPNNDGVYSVKRYTAIDRGNDNITVKYPYLLNVFGNGNDQTTYPGGFNTCTQGTKNSLYVGAIDPNDLMSSYSSFGPTSDGRLVPHIVAVGTEVFSLDYLNSYTKKQGTSMATPNVTGTVALLCERYKNIYNQRPLASLMKALVSNTAKDLGNSGPDYKYGFGSINGLRAIKVLEKKMFYTASLTHGTDYEKEIEVPQGLVSLKVMLAYSDPGATPGAASILVNDLDIKITKDGAIYLPWILNPSAPNSNVTRGVDSMNNIEQITLDHPAAGVYKIIVSGKSIPRNTQEFSVVYDFVTPELILTYPIGKEKFNPGTSEYIRWDYEGPLKSFMLEYSIDGGINYAVIAKDISSSARNFVWQVPEGVSASAKIRISAGLKIDISKDFFSIISEPKNLIIAPVTCGESSFKMDWAPVAGAKYEVLKLDKFKFIVVATVLNPTYTFENVSKGEDNWFSVRAVDVATGLVSERVRAVNVEPISKPVLSSLHLPLVENFNERKADNYIFSKGSEGTINYEFINAELKDGIKMGGANSVTSSLWVASTNENAFTNNPNFIKRMTFCDIDSKGLLRKTLHLKFNLIWKNVTFANKTFFRVLINGIPVKSHNDIIVYGGANLMGDVELIYDLSTFAGSVFSVALESVIDNDVIKNDEKDIFNSVYIDNVSFSEVSSTDLELSSLLPNTGFTSEEIVKVKVYNHSLIALSNVPVSYKINGGEEVSEIIPGPVKPLGEISYSFTKTADFSAHGIYNVISTVNFTNDVVSKNNMRKGEVRNLPNEVTMGSQSNITTCSILFTDSGSRYTNYGDQLEQVMTFKPAFSTNNIKIEFTAFDLEEDKDFLYIYNGSNDKATLLGKYTGNSLPHELTSYAMGGELTFKFVSNNAVNHEGWMANISCVPKPNIIDLSVLAIVTPEVQGRKTGRENVTITVRNLGSAPSLPSAIFYQVNEGAITKNDIDPIPAYTSYDFLFSGTADLSSSDARYKIRSWIEIDDANNLNNSIEKIVYNKVNSDEPVIVNHGENTFAISKLKWNSVENVSGISSYSNFKNIVIPVRAGIKYQPEITIAKPDKPFDNSNGQDQGVFSIIIIDLNGDGDLSDEFEKKNYWINTLSTSVKPTLASTTNTHYFRKNFSLDDGLTIPANTTTGPKLMRVVHMFRRPLEIYDLALGLTLDKKSSSSNNLEVEEYTIDILPLSSADVGVEEIVTPVKPSNRPINVVALVHNFSNLPISNFPVAYSINSENEIVETFSESIAPGKTGIFSFAAKANLSNSINYKVDVYTKMTGDEDMTNNAKSVRFSRVENNPVNVVGTFDGVDDFVKTDLAAGFNLTNNYTFEAWINQKKISNFAGIFDKGAVKLYLLNNKLIENGNSLVIEVRTAKGSCYMMTYTNSIKSNTWHHVAYSVSSLNAYTIFIDGIAVPFVTTGLLDFESNNSEIPIYIAYNRDIVSSNFNGKIDELRIWSGVRDRVTIAANAMQKYEPNEPGLLAYYSFSEGDKEFVFDSSINDNTAIIKNADVSGRGEDKFWNIPVLLQKINFKNQLSSSYDANTRTFTILLNEGQDKSAITSDLSLGMSSIAKINGIQQVNKTTANNYSSPVTLFIEGTGFNAGITEIYTINIISGLKKESKLLSYNFNLTSNPNLPKGIVTNIIGNNVSKTSLFDYDVTHLRADFTVSSGAELYIDGVKQLNSITIPMDYTNSFMVTVVSEDKLSQNNYNITLDTKNSEARILKYSVENQIGESIIDPVLKTVKIFVNNNADLDVLKPSFQVSAFATIKIGADLQNSGITAISYNLPVTYNVTAQNGNMENWTITIERANPVITLLGDSIVSLSKGCEYIEKGTIAKDNLGNDLTSEVFVSGSVDVNIADQYVLIYTVKDRFQNTSVITRTVNILNSNCHNLGLAKNIIEGFLVYPNPVKNGILYIKTKSDLPKEIYLTDMAGKTVLSLKTRNQEIDIAHLQQGIYIVRVMQDDNTSVQKIIVK